MTRQPRIAELTGDNAGVQVLKRALKLVTVFLMLIFSVAYPARGQATTVGEATPVTHQDVPPAGHQVIILLDTNPHQKKVLMVEIALAEAIIQKLSQPANEFSVITLGSGTPTVLKHAVIADEAIGVVRGIAIEDNWEKYFSVRFFDALTLALDQFADDARPKSVLVISEGNDYFPPNTFKETVSRMQQLQVICDAAMVASHSFYGTKGIQRYGFDLRRLVGKTHGQYVEVGGNQKKVVRSAERLSEAIRSRETNALPRS